MRALVNSVTYWDVVCLNKIFGLDGKKLVSIIVFESSRSFHMEFSSKILIKYSN